MIGITRRSNCEPVKVKRNRVWANVGGENPLELVKSDGTRAIPSPDISYQTWHRVGETRIHVEILKGHVIVCVWAFEQGLEDHKVIPRQKAALRRVRDAKEDGEL